MRPLLIAEKDATARRQMVDFFGNAGYQVIAVDSVADTLRATLKKDPQVLILGGELDAIPLVKVVPVLKKCSADLIIILVTDEASLPQMRKFRKEGIFYHALRPVDSAGQQELLQVVQCAFRKSRQERESHGWDPGRMPTLTLHPNG